MLYFKNNELAEKYHVSLRTVLNWIESAKKGKLNLALYARGDKTYIANTAQNTATISQMVKERRKYRNSRGHKTVTPKPEFYGLYNEQQIFDIITNLETYHEIPLHYSYFGEGAKYWDNYTARMSEETTPNLLNSTLKLLDINWCYIEELISGYERVNVVDIGIGNGYPVKDLLSRLIKKGVMGRYIGLDISPEMLDTATGNIKKWFRNKITCDGHQLDINYTRFNNLLIEEYFKKRADKTLNLVLMLGGTLNNFRSPDAALRVIHDSMGTKDLFIETSKLDSETSRHYFDFSLLPGHDSLAPNHKLIPDLLNIDEDFYDVHMCFDKKLIQRRVRIEFKVALTINFKFADGDRPVHFNKGDSILPYRFWHYRAKDIMQLHQQNDLDPIHLSHTPDGDYLLTISRIMPEKV